MSLTATLFAAGSLVLSKPFTFTKQALLAGALCLMVTQARAAVITHTLSETRSGSAAVGSVDIPQFDPGTGNLDSVLIQIDPFSRVEAAADGTNPTDTAEVVTFQFQATLRLFDETERISALVSGSTSLLISAGAGSSSFLVGQVTGSSQLVTDPVGLLRWTGPDTHRLSWDLTDFNATVQAANSTGSVVLQTVTISVTVVYTYSLPEAPNPMNYDPTDNTFHYVEGDRPVVIEHRANLVDVLPWNLRYETGTNAPGTIVKFPLEGETGFYRVRFADPTPSRVVAPEAREAWSPLPEWLTDICP